MMMMIMIMMMMIMMMMVMISEDYLLHRSCTQYMNSQMPLK